MADRFIVAEISKNWEQNTGPTDLLSQRFEMVINKNLERGYKLIDWKINGLTYNVKEQMDPDNERWTTVVNETIIAIFEKINPD